MRPLLLSLCLCALIVAGAWTRAAETSIAAGEPLAEVPRDRPHDLRVLYLIDPRLPVLTRPQRAELHTKIEVLMRDWFGYTVTLREVGVKDLAKTFATFEPVFARHGALLQYDIDPTTDSGRDRLRATIVRGLAPHPLNRIEQHLAVGPLPSRERAAELAFETFLTRLAALQAIPVGSNGEPFSSPSRRRLTSYAHWCAVTHEMSDADIIFTNSMMLGADIEMGLYVIGRGGVSNGSINGNRHNAYRAGCMVSLFPFLSDAPFWLRERGPLPDPERPDVIATMAMHELGHFFLRRAEYFDHPNCVHVGPVRFRYYEWHRGIREHGPCRLEHQRVTSY